LPLPSDIARALELGAKFEGLELGLVDGTVAAVAERRQVYRILIRVGRAAHVPLNYCRDTR
jgi:hypothetical protein